DLAICRQLGDVQGEGQTLANLGVLYEHQNQPDQALDLWHQALTKLHPDSPKYATVSQWIHAATQPRRPDWLGWFLSLGIGLFLLWNLINRHWLIALFSFLILIGWYTFRRRR
ncbi:MAG: tetratricopeptide repeat protein, partial [Synechococcales cyanobacterium T60_A2020_003]|nr:tetratricopeptide repeat protein [Synechococcales cyanobacterium T60_A2020_003]